MAGYIQSGASPSALSCALGLVSSQFCCWLDFLSRIGG
jgi:hypothetical protein